MTRRKLVNSATVCAALSLVGSALAQEPFAYPPAGATPEQQRLDQYECHQWAAEQSHFDPVQYAAQTTPQTTESEADQATRVAGGGAVRGAAVRGAARGAVIGEVADEDTGDAARAGAALGLMRQRRAQGAAAAERAEAQQAAEQQRAQQSRDLQAKQQAYQRARNTCYKARGYTLSEA